MAGQRDLSFASPAASALDDRSHLATSSSLSDAHAQGSSRMNRLSDQTPNSNHAGSAGTVDAASISDDNGPDPTSAPESQSVGINRRDTSESHISALTAVSHYPSAMDNEPSFPPVSEVVNAVMEPDEVYGRGMSSNRENAPQAELYMSDAEMGDTLGDLSAPGTYEADGEVDMGAIVQHFIHNPGVGHNVSTIVQDSDGEYGDDLVMDYDSAMLRDMSTPSTPREDDPDDTRKFYLDDDGDGYTERPQRRSESQLSDVDFDDFYRSFDYESMSQLTDTANPATQDGATFSPDNEAAGGEVLNDNDVHFLPSAVHGTTHEQNFSIDKFIQQWLALSVLPLPNVLPIRPLVPPNSISNIICWPPPEKITRPNKYPGDCFDLQQIPWWETLRVKRSEARALRDVWYTSYHNLDYLPHRNSKRIPRTEFYFQEKSMYTKHKASIEHFQLRNLMSVACHNTVQFAHESKLYSWIPGYDDLTCLIDLSSPGPESYFHSPVKISSMKSAHNVSIAGGFYGEYAMRAMGTDGPGVEGYVTHDLNGITNHVDIIQHRTNRSPMGILASNDKHLRILDCETNTFVADHQMSRAINCTSTSPDGRLRVVIGDSPDAWVIEADTGKPVHPLRGHRDFGFACAWSPDMRHIATSNQDKTVIIWDARTWRILETIESDVAGYRSLRYSPVGGGPRTLLLSEPADRISIVNAQTYQSRQVHDFFGEIGGADYSPDGSTIWVANTDAHFGGFMEFERRQWGQRYGLRESPNEWVHDTDLDDDERCLLSERERRMRVLWNLDDEEHEDLFV